MNKRLLVDFAAVLTTLAEVSNPAPASMVYLALGGDMDRYLNVVSLLERAGLVRPTEETLTLTKLGREKAVKLAEALG